MLPPSELSPFPRTTRFTSSASKMRAKSSSCTCSCPTLGISVTTIEDHACKGRVIKKNMKNATPTYTRYAWQSPQLSSLLLLLFSFSPPFYKFSSENPLFSSFPSFLFSLSSLSLFSFLFPFSLSSLSSFTSLSLLSLLFPSFPPLSLPPCTMSHPK